MEQGNDDSILDEPNEKAWREYLKEFYDDVYPLFKPYGVSMGEALIVFHVNRVVNRLPILEDEDEWHST